VRTDRQTYMTKMIVTFRNFAYASNKIVPRSNSTMIHSIVTFSIPLSLLALSLFVAAAVTLSLNFFALMLNVAVGRRS
jgi:hypothetical protein